MTTTLGPHAHHWRLVAIDEDWFGVVRMFECQGCAAVRYE